MGVVSSPEGRTSHSDTGGTTEGPEAEDPDALPPVPPSAREPSEETAAGSAALPSSLRAGPSFGISQATAAMAAALMPSAVSHCLRVNFPISSGIVSFKKRHSPLRSSSFFPMSSRLVFFFFSSCLFLSRSALSSSFRFFFSRSLISFFPAASSACRRSATLCQRSLKSMASPFISTACCTHDMSAPSSRGGCSGSFGRRLGASAGVSPVMHR